MFRFLLCKIGIHKWVEEKVTIGSGKYIKGAIDCDICTRCGKNRHQFELDDIKTMWGTVDSSESGKDLPPVKKTGEITHWVNGDSRFAKRFNHCIKIIKRTKGYGRGTCHDV